MAGIGDRGRHVACMDSTLTREDLLRELARRKRMIESDVSVGLLPSDVGGILAQAARGWDRRQSKLADEIVEKDWDISQALQTRTAAVVATEWDIVPARAAEDERSAAAAAAEVKRLLEGIEGDDDRGLLDFRGWIEAACDAIVPGFAVSEIAWQPGGGITGFAPLPAWYFSHYDSTSPRLVRDLDEGAAEPLEPRERFAIHRRARHHTDPARGGLIRPLAWLFAFKNLTWKHLLRYTEKFGMPYVLAQISASDDKVFQREAEEVMDAVEDMGSDGGAVVSGLTDLQFVDGSRSEGAVFFSLLEKLQKGIDRLVLGQTSTSDSATSNRSTAAVHDLVRHDLRAADCRAIERTANQQILRPLCMYHGIAPQPALSFDVVSWAVAGELLNVVKTAKEAGLRLSDVGELNRQAGLTFEHEDEDDDEDEEIDSGT